MFVLGENSLKCQSKKALREKEKEGRDDGQRRGVESRVDKRKCEVKRR